MNPLQNTPMGQMPPMAGGMGPNNQGPNSMPGPINQPMPGQNPMDMMGQMIFNRMYQSIPRFRQFADSMIADSMQGKTPEQAFQEQGLDYSQFQNVNPAQIKNMLGF